MSYNEDLASRIRGYFAGQPVAAVEKRMMGGLCFMVRDKMCVGVYRDQLMVRLDPAARAEALSRPGCAPMTFTGRTLQGFVVVSPEGWTAPRDFERWLAIALEFNPRAVSSKTTERKRSGGRGPARGRSKK